jgi:hypothetical protein
LIDSRLKRSRKLLRMINLGFDLLRCFFRVLNWILPPTMLEGLESAAKDLSVSRQAVIKTLVRQALDQRQRARASRTRAKRS